MCLQFSTVPVSLPGKMEAVLLWSVVILNVFCASFLLSGEKKLADLKIVRWKAVIDWIYTVELCGIFISVSLARYLSLICEFDQSVGSKRFA